MKKIMLSVLVVIVLYACTKKDDTATPSAPINKTEVLTTNTWVVAKILVDGEDFTNDSWACEIDDQFIFKPNKEFIRDEGGSKCSATDPQIVNTGSWSFGADETKLFFQSDYGSGHDIKEFTQSKVTLESVDAGVTYTVDYTILK